MGYGSRKKEGGWVRVSRAGDSSNTSFKIKISTSLWVRSQTKVSGWARSPWENWSRRKYTVCVLLKKAQATWEEYENVVRVCRDMTRKTKAHVELNLARNAKDNNKGFFKYISSKTKTWENVGPLLSGVDAVVVKDTEKEGLLNAFFASVFTSMTSLQGSQLSEARLKGWGKEDVSLVEEDQVRNASANQTFTSPWPWWEAPWVLRELAFVVMMPLSIIRSIMVTRISVWRLEESKCYSYHKKGQEFPQTFP